MSLTERDAFAWSIGSMVDGAADMVPSVRAVVLMREAARLIAESGALPARCDNAAKLFRQMMAEEAAGAPFPVTPEMLKAWEGAKRGR